MSFFSKNQKSSRVTYPNSAENRFINGQISILNGKRRLLRFLMHKFSADYTNKNKRVLIMDTINSLNPHHPVFNTSYQKRYFKNISCVRTPMPYDLWARLGTSESFIRNNRIDVLLITSLSLLFNDYNLSEVEPLIFNILNRAEYLTKKYKLITIIANSPSKDNSVSLAFKNLSNQKNVLEVKI